MKKLMVALVLTAALAGAKDMTGRLGVGSSTTLGGVTGMAIEYQLSKTLTLEPILSLHVDDGEMMWALGLTAFLNLADMDNANLLVGVGLSASSNPAFDDQPMGMSISLPVKPVWFPTDRIALHLSTGLNINFMQPGNDTPAGDHESVMIIDLGGHLFGNAGATFYF